MSRKILYWIALVVIVIAASGGGYFFYQRAQAAPQATEEAPVQTATVQRGSLVISASGTGAIIPANEVKLSFESSGKISALNVEVGDEVQAGDVLALLESSDSSATLASQLKSAELTVLKAQQNLDDLKTPPDALSVAQAEIALTQAKDSLSKLLNPSASDLAQAELDVVTAQDAADTAQGHVTQLSTGRASQSQISTARAAYLLAQDKVDRMQEKYEQTDGDPAEDAGKALALSQLSTAESERNRALATLNWYLGEPTDAEIAEKNMELAVAQAALADAQEKLATLKGPSTEDIALAEAQVADLQGKLDDLKAGASDLDIQIAEADLANAQALLALKQEAAAQQSLVTPSAGTILSVDAQVGDTVGTNAIITLADLSQPMLEVFVDETDFNNIGIGYEVEVVFDALPDQTFAGHVLSVDPSLVSSGMVQAVRGVVQLDPGAFSKPQNLPVGLNASVEVIGSQAKDVLLVPVEALRELSAGKYGVFIMENGQPKLKVVEVGLMDLTYAEIKSGLNEGDVVTTGVVETGQ